MLVKPVALCSRPRTWMVWVRVDQAEAGFSLTTTEVTSAFAPRWTVSWLGYDEPSKYVVTSPSLALAGAWVNMYGVPSIGLFSARLVPVPPLPVRVTVLLAADSSPAALVAV